MNAETLKERALTVAKARLEIQRLEFALADMAHAIDHDLPKNEADLWNSPAGVLNRATEAARTLEDFLLARLLVEDHRQAALDELGMDLLRPEQA